MEVGVYTRLPSYFAEKALLMYGKSGVLSDDSPLELVLQHRRPANLRDIVPALLGNKA
jgi:hypothetical protein